MSEFSEPKGLVPADKPINDDAPSKPICLLVLGMHRSGTSALTRVLSLAGARLPKDLMGSGPANETGHWESNRLVHLHDEMLAEFGSRWNDWRPFDVSRMPLKRRSEIKAEIIAALTVEYGDAPLIVVKDPRICRFAPLFIDAAGDAGYDVRLVLLLRNPLEVCQSLEKRDRMERPDSALLWLRHVLDAERASRNHERVILSYADLMADWKQALEQVATVVGIEWPYAPQEIETLVDEFLAPRLRHHVHKSSDIPLDADLRHWVADAYQLLMILARNPSSDMAMRELDAIHAGFDDLAPLLHRHQEVLLNRAKQRENDLQRIISAKSDEVRQLAAHLAERETQLASSDRMLKETETALTALRGEANRAGTAYAKALEDRTAELARVEARLDTMRRAFLDSTSWKLTAPIRAAKRGALSLATKPRTLVATYRGLRNAVEIGGGFRTTARKTLGIYRTEGIDGIRWRYREVLRLYPISQPASSGERQLTSAPSASDDGSRKIGIPQSGREVPKEVDENHANLRQQVLASGFWDENWYLTLYGKQFNSFKTGANRNDVVDPLDYYLREGWKLGHEPSALLPLRIDQSRVGTNKIDYFLNRLRFYGYHFEKNIWIPSEERIRNYVEQKGNRCATKVVYTCIAGGYDGLLQPYFISDEWDYVCFTDDPGLIHQGQVGVWEVRELVETQLDTARSNRWHKIHPHILFPNYAESLYIDGNVNIISCYIFDQILRRGSDILLPEHFARKCTYQEIEALLHSSRISARDKVLLASHRQFLEQEGFPQNFGLSENNLIYRRHHSTTVQKLMQDWWAMYMRFSSRDQASLGYVFWKNALHLPDCTVANCRVNYRDFWVVKHGLSVPYPDRLKARALAPAFERNNIAAVFSTNEAFIPYLGVAIYSLIQNSSPTYNYDIVILANELGDQLESVRNLALGRSNVSIRIYDTGDLIASLPTEIFHVEGYVPIETYNKCFLTEILSGYDRCLYLDSDILVLDDIQKLHEIDLQGCAIGASVNVANVNAAFCEKVIKGRRFDKYLEDELGVRDHAKYFQAGVLLLNMKKLALMNLPELTIQAIKIIDKPIFFDQCIFNYLFYDDVRFFSTAWNHVWYMQQYSYLRGSVPEEVFFDYAHGRVDPKIIHYAGKQKPQNHLGWKLADRFWQYAYQSPFFDAIRKDVLKQNNDVSAIIRRERTYEWSRVSPRVLVHLHLYYVDQIEVMMAALRNISGCDYDLFVTMVERNKNAEATIRNVVAHAQFLVLPNAGYDVYPFLHVINQVRLADYEFLLKIHTKNARQPGQDQVYGISVSGYKWRDDLLHALLGSKEIFEQNLQLLSSDLTLGCVGAGQYIFSTLENNEEMTYSLSEWREKCGATRGTHYVGGSMFMARAFPFERLKGLRMTPNDFDSKNMRTKDYKNKAHIFERLFGIVIENEGYEIRGS